MKVKRNCQVKCPFCGWGFLAQTLPQKVPFVTPAHRHLGRTCEGVGLPYMLLGETRPLLKDVRKDIFREPN